MEGGGGVGIAEGKSRKQKENEKKPLKKKICDYVVGRLQKYATLNSSESACPYMTLRLPFTSILA